MPVRIFFLRKISGPLFVQRSNYEKDVPELPRKYDPSMFTPGIQSPNKSLQGPVTINIYRSVVQKKLTNYNRNYNNIQKK